MFKSRKFAILGSFALLMVSALFPTYHGHFQELSFISDQQFDEDLKLLSFVHQFDRYFEESIARKNCPGLAVTVVKGNQTVLEKGYGYQSVKSGVPIDEHTLFRLASNSKGIASALAGILVHKGIIDWDDHLTDYLPEFRMQDPNHAGKIQLKHILSHSAGFPYHTYTNLVEAKVEMDKIIKEMAKVKPIGEPGQIYSYQNAAYSLIGEAIEATTGKDIHESLKEYLFKPLEMNDASTKYDLFIDNENVASPHVKVKGGWAETRHKNIYYNAVPAGGVNASIADMSKYLKALMGYSNELPPHILDEMFAPQVSCPAKWKYFRGWSEVESLDYGLGWRIVNFKGRKIVYHGGYIRGYRSEIAFDPEEEIAICLLTNSGSSFPKESLHKFLRAYYEESGEALNKT